ncbi:MAG: polyphosphate polymerase domain-containing protein [Bacteroidia bacterium]
MDIRLLLHAYQPVSLAEMDEVALTNRIDTKYVFHRSMLPEVLANLSDAYAVLTIDGQQAHPYETLYFDKKDFGLYFDHHNQRGNRYKLRLRKYGNSAVQYMEMKRKTNTGRTVKSRTRTDSFSTQLTSEQLRFFREKTGDPLMHWQFSNRNCFDRITLVSMNPPERMTLDLNITFEDERKKFMFEHLVIAEVKQGSKAPSAFIRLMRDRHIHPFSISKYCVGITLLHPELKHNLFKRQQQTLINLQNRA